MDQTTSNSPAGGMERNQKLRRRWLKGCLVIEVMALIAAFLSAGGGHGDYLFAKLLFPVPMYLGIMRHILDLPAIILLLVQYPLVGLIPFVFSWRQTKYIYSLLAIIHVIFVFMVFAHPSTQFG